MELLFTFGQALLIGVAIAAPVGPIGVLCIRASLTGGFATGLACGLGAAAADGVYGVVAAFGLLAVDRLSGGAFSTWGTAAGGALLLFLAIRIATAPVTLPEANAPKSKKQLAGGFLSTFILTLSNPATIISFIAIFAGLGLVMVENTAAKIITVAGVFLGSLLWWLLLAGTASRFQARLTERGMKYINGLSAVIIGDMGLLAFGKMALG